MSEIFRIRGTDKRPQFEEAYENGHKFRTQKLGGKSVKFFSPQTGFALLRQEAPLKTESKTASEIYAISKMSHGTRMSLRELYYTLRQTPEYSGFFNPNSFYSDVLTAINRFEIVCDVDRKIFVQGQPKGIFYYPHNYSYGDKSRLIALSEDLVTKTISEWDVKNAMNVLTIEKMAIAHGLTQSDFPKLINSIVATTGGQFDRATRKMMKRWQHSKNVMAFCDGDVWGVYMVQTCHIGSKASRHLDDKMRDVLDAGLYPSIARDINCPEDIDEKKPMSSEYSAKRVELLEFIGYPEIDLQVFSEDNQTYELEALNTKYRDEGGKPIGAQIYITELLRALDLPCKPQPPEDDERLLEQFKEEALEKFDKQVEEQIVSEDLTWSVRGFVEERLKEITAEVVKRIQEKYKQELTDLVENVTAEKIREKVAEQYQNDPYREKYNLSEIAEQMMKVEVEVPWDEETIETVIGEELDNYFEGKDDACEETIELQDLPDAEELRPFYDVVIDEIGANPEDAEEIREALERRLK